MIIDPDELFVDERLASCSDKAQLLYPWLLISTNGYARLELAYRKVRARTFRGLVNPPSEEDFLAAIREYTDCGLSFVYQAPNGEWWAQFVNNERRLPRYKTARDEASPTPPGEAFQKHLESVVAARRGGPEDSRKLERIFGKPPKSFGNVPKVSAGEERSGVGVGEVLERSGERTAVVLIPLKDGTDFAVTEEQVRSWTESYRSVDVVDELRKCREWSLANPSRQKTRSGANRFIVAWLSRTNREQSQRRTNANVDRAEARAATNADNLKAVLAGLH